MAFYWYGGTGNWSDYTNHWSGNSGNSPADPKGAAPTSTDNVIFDTNSASGNYTVTVDAAANCADFTAAAPSSGNMTLAGSQALNIYGSLTFYASMVRTYTGTITFKDTATGKTINTAGVSLGGPVTFNGSGGGWTLAADLAGFTTMTLTNGTFDTDTYDLTGTSFALGSGTKTLTLGSGTHTFSSTSSTTAAWNFGSNTTGLTFDAESSTITITGEGGYFKGGGKTYNNVSFTTTKWHSITGVNTFNDLTATGISNFCGLNLNENQTISGTLTITGVSTKYFFELAGPWDSMPTITAAAVSLTNVYFRDIAAAGAASPWTGTVLGDCGCTGITTDSPVDRYWIGNGGSWSDTAHWSASDGGGGGASIPLPQDTAYFTAASLSTSSTVTIDMTIIGNLDASGADQTLVFDSASVTLTQYGDIKLKSGVSYKTGSGGPYHMAYRSDVYVETGDGYFGNFYAVRCSTITGRVFKVIASGTCRFTSTGTWEVRLPDYGIFDANDQDIYCGSNHPNIDNISYGGAGATALYMGNGTWYLSGTSNCWDGDESPSYLDIFPEGSTIKITTAGSSGITFVGGGYTYNNFWDSAGSGTRTLTLSGNNTFNEFKLSGTAAHSVKFTNSSTTTVSSFIADGNLGKKLTITNTSGTTKANLSCSSGIINCTNLTISNIAAAGGATWNAWESTGSNTTGWNIFRGDQFNTP